MLFFAVGVAVVALLFYNFIVTLGLHQDANNMLLTNARIVSDQLNSDLTCSFKTTSIQDRFYYGIGGIPLYYDLEMTKQSFGDASLGNQQNQLIMRIVEHKSSTRQNQTKNVLATKAILTDAQIVLIDPGFLKELAGISDVHYNKDIIALYPRAGSSSELQASSPDSFVALKEIENGKTTIYIIPCATAKESQSNNCLNNILRLGCYKLSKEYTGNLNADNPLLPSCFNVTTQLGPEIERSKNFRWADCSNVGFVNANIGMYTP